MRTAPAVQFPIDQAGVWRAGVSAALLLSAVVLAVWFTTSTASAWAVHLCGGVSGFIALAGAATLLRGAPLSLRWDTQRWHLGPAATAGEEPLAGDVDVMLDLGGWMLLRFRPETASRPWQVRRLAAERRGRAALWHALRCAVYSPRPDPGLLAGSDAAVVQQPRLHPTE